MAFLSKLLYWTNGDKDTAIQAFLSSPYVSQKDDAHKKKLERADYLPRVVNAITEDFSNLPIAQNTAVCFIVEHTGDEKFLEQLADKFLDLPCRRFNFYGKYRGRGETIFDHRDIERGYTPENVALTSCYLRLEELAKYIYVKCICCKQDVLVLYDDVSVYHQLLQLTRKLFPWWHRKHIPKVGKQSSLPL